MMTRVKERDLGRRRRRNRTSAKELRARAGLDDPPLSIAALRVDLEELEDLPLRVPSFAARRRRIPSTATAFVPGPCPGCYRLQSELLELYRALVALSGGEEG